MHRSRILLLALSVGPLLACSSPGADGEGPEHSSTGGATTGGAATTGAGAGGGGGGAPVFDAGAEMTTFEASIGPATVAPGAEETRCVVVRLHNPEPVFVRRLRTTLGDSAHHFIAYRSDAAEEQLTPEPCAGFSGISTGEHPIFIAQHGDSELVFPSDGDTPVGLEIAANQMLRLEMHWLNASGAPKEITGTASVDTVPLQTKVIPSDLAFWGTTHLNAGGDPPGDTIPAGSAGDTGMMFQAAPAGTKLFALTTHQHYLGTRMRVWKAESPAEAGALLADETDWANPAVERFDPAVELLEDQGLFYRCEWKNVTQSEVTFGESAVNNEMCFLWHFHYPSKGFSYCVDGVCL